MVESFQELANTTGKTTTEIANMATKFYQQGKSTSQVLELTEAAAKAATIAGIDGSRSIDLLTNAMNGFQMSADKAMEVSDKFAALAASAATDYEELATALSKVAAQANLAGMSMDFTLGMLTKGIEVTREAPETIGTALKTVIARMRELTDYGTTLEDNMDVNRVEKALGNIGVELRDQEGQFRDLEYVLTEVGKKWNTLNKNQQANVAVALAGTRQQSRLIAMMQDFDRTLELVDISANSYGATMAQSAKYMEGLSAKMTLLTNAWQQLITTVTDSEIIIKIVEILTGLVNGVANILSNTTLLHTILIGVSVVGLVILGQKMQENLLQKQITTSKNEEHKIDLKKKKIELELHKIKQKAKLEEQKKTVEAAKQLRLEEEQKVASLEKLANEAKGAEKAALEEKLAKARLDVDAAKELQLEAEAAVEQTKLDIQHTQTQEMQLQMEMTQELVNDTGILGATLQGVFGIASAIVPIVTLLVGLGKLAVW